MESIKAWKEASMMLSETPTVHQRAPVARQRHGDAGKRRDRAGGAHQPHAPRADLLRDAMDAVEFGEVGGDLGEFVAGDAVVEGEVEMGTELVGAAERGDGRDPVAEHPV